ncbi:brain-specific angiogenesis inhibitor 1-associated protein 2 [Nerophis ophidion]|uniref:brain-specific angiogenesis inhibitor 1-associated protein 2 n=1 Tax=Nerophis ophidion TaxID=159077 RepID=UPI002AE06B04|nr:brain-specific angiogenesis inhibitor 1-associated protein 2 [Nerophis ophidion]XP_061771232.1 brain-specific angiogenesis inhibitor 1-associated protein 2 [Nerophis ophidion]
MSRTDEVNKMTENVYKGILDHFNPSLKNFVTMGKHYEKALTGVTLAAKGYFDALVKLGELASDSQGSKELGDTLFQMAEVHRQIQVQLEDVLKLFHSELLAQLDQKLELDIKYLTATLKKYQTERRSKSESIERCQAQLKKLRRKSLGSRHPNKYGDREMQFVELMSRRQVELDTLVATGYRSALTEERRRYCFLVERQCCVSKMLINYHCKVRELLAQKVSSWQQSCTQPTKLPERALNLMRHTAPQSSGAAGVAELLRHTKPEQVTASSRSHKMQFEGQLHLLEEAQPSPVQRPSVPEVPPLLNGGRSQPRSLPSSSSQSESPPTSQGFSRGGSPQLGVSTQAASPSLLMAANTSHLSPSLIPSTVMSVQQVSPSSSCSQGVTLAIPHSPPLTHSAPLSRAVTPVHQGAGPAGNSTPPWLMKAADMCGTSTLPLPRKPGGDVRLAGFPGSRVLAESGPRRVAAMFAHAPAASEGGSVASLLHFLAGDSVTLLISEPRDGWHYGRNERTGRKGWFPFSYTQHAGTDHLDRDHFLSKANSTSMSGLDQLVSPPLAAESDEDRRLPPPRVSTFRPRPYSMADSQQITAQLASPPSSPTRANPFAHVRLRKTVTNDRSAPIME